MPHCRTPQQQADEFIAANRHFLVVAGAIVYHRGKQSGVRYKLENNKWYTLGSKAAAMLPSTPRWLGVDL